MNDLEITALPIADSHDIDKLKTLGYDDQANASQVRLSDLKTQPMKASRIDYTTGLFFTKVPFVIGSSNSLSTVSAMTLIWTMANLWILKQIVPTASRFRA